MIDLNPNSQRKPQKCLDKKEIYLFQITLVVTLLSVSRGFFQSKNKNERRLNYFIAKCLFQLWVFYFIIKPKQQFIYIMLCLE